MDQGNGENAGHIEQEKTHLQQRRYRLINIPLVANLATTWHIPPSQMRIEIEEKKNGYARQLSRTILCVSNL